MSSFVPSYQINGILDTGKSVFENIQKLANASGCWFTFDINTGLWSVIINTTGTSVASFDDSNIVGNISISGKGIRELYNKVRVEFPNDDILDDTDFTEYSIDSADMFPNEVENTLQFKMDLVNRAEHAQRLALTELKQSRVDKIIQFRTDFSMLGLKAGDIIDVTSSMYGYSAKLFRITEISEEDNEDGNLNLKITALEYDSEVYNYSEVFRESRDRANGIIVKTINDTTKEEDDKSMSKQLERMLAASMVTGLLNAVLTRNPLTGVLTQAISNSTTGQRVQDAFTDATRANIIKSLNLPLTISGSSSICEGSTLSLTLGSSCDTCMFDETALEYDYTITGVQAADISPFPLTGKINLNETKNIPIANDGSSETETLVFTVGSVSKSVTITDRLSFTYSTSASPTSITEGSSSTVTLTTTGVSDGTTIPYTITGTGTGRVTTALTGNVTVNSNSATLVVNTVDDGTYTGTQSVTVTFNSSLSDPCSQLDKTASITINDNDSPPAADTTCSYVSVPVVWCGTYDGADNQLKSVTAAKTMLFPVPLAGEATITVPKTLTVTKGNPSTITVASTETIAASHASMGGQPVQIITTFNTVVPKGLITGTTTTIYGY